MTWAERFVDWLLGIVVRHAIEKRDAKVAAEILKSIDEKPWLRRHVLWRDVMALRAIKNEETT